MDGVDAIKAMRDYLTKSPSVVFPQDVLKFLPAIEAENAKLRELVVLQSVIFKHMSTCPTTDCQVCPVNDECAEAVHLEGLLGIDDKETSWLVQWRSEGAADVQAENAKLREQLVEESSERVILNDWHFEIVEKDAAALHAY